MKNTKIAEDLKVGDALKTRWKRSPRIIKGFKKYKGISKNVLCIALFKDGEELTLVKGRYYELCEEEVED